MVNIQRLKLSTNIDKPNNFSPQIIKHRKDHDMPIEIQVMGLEITQTIWRQNSIFGSIQGFFQQRDVEYL